MLRKVIIKNFQAHEELEFFFHPGVNVITGPSDVGKSAVIRAIRWVLENRPQGTGFLNWETDLKVGCSVTLIFQGGDEITRERTSAHNSYIVNGVRLDAVRTDVPKEVTEIANVLPCCLQTQLSPYFLLQDTSGEVARRLNEVAGLDIISESLKSVNSVERQARADAETAKEEAGAIRISLERLVPLTDAAELLQRAESAWSTVSSMQEDIGKIGKLCASYRLANLGLLRFKTLSYVEDMLNVAKKQEQDLAAYEESLRKVKYAINRLKEIKPKLEKERNLTIISRKLTVLKDEMEELAYMEKQVERINTLLTNLSSTLEELEQKQDQIQVVEADLEQMKRELGNCPLCGGKL